MRRVVQPKIAQRYSTNEQSALFYDTAARVYRL
jgi:hypothetical protein